MQRRLAAILIADVVGYSRLMEEDEAGTLAALQARRSTIVDPVVRAHSGRVVKVMGDGILIEFASAMNAVSAALALQEGMAEANRRADRGRDIVLRIGINLGDLIGTGRDVYGETVNVAARLESLAEPGGVCISGKVHEEVARKLDCVFEDLGPQTVKNITRPVHAYQVRSGRAATAAAPEPAAAETVDLALPEKPSIAVLPFQNMSADPEQEYFADGMVEDIITELSRAKWLFVIARNSSFTYKGRAVDIKQVGRELGVRYVLEGSVRKSGSRIRITGQLIEAANGTHLWADRFDGDAADVFDLQDHVTESVVGAIAPRLELAEIDRAARKPTHSLDAYDHYLRGMAHFNAFDPASNVEALARFLRAAELDPGFAAALGMASRCFGQRSGFGWITDMAGERAEGLRLARRAADIASDDAIALAAAGFTAVTFGEAVDGDAYLEQALAINPNLAWGLNMSGFAKALLGQHDEAVDRSSRAIRLSPRDPHLFGMQSVVALGHFLAGRYAEAMPFASASLRQRSNFLFGACVTAACASFVDRPDEAAAAMRRVRDLRPSLTVGTLNEWTRLQVPADAARLAEGMRRAGLPE